MSEPVRFKDGGGSDLARLVVDSVRDEAPSPRARRRVEAAVGVGVGVSATAAAGNVLGATAKTGASLVLGKWTGAVAVTVLAGVGTTTYLATTKAHDFPQAAATAASHLSAHPSPPPAAPTPEAMQVAPPVETEDAPVPAPSAATPITSAVPRAAAKPVRLPPSLGLSLGDELRMLDDAHAALNAGDTARALSLLERHEREAKAPALGPEAMALRIEVYDRKGDRANLVRVAKQFLALHGDRPQVQRVRSLLDAALGEAEANP